MRHIIYTDRTNPHFGEHDATGFWGERLRTGSRTFHAIHDDRHTALYLFDDEVLSDDET